MNAKTTIKTKTEPKTLLFCNSKRKKLIQKIAENFVEAGLILKEERLRGLRGQEGLRDKPECIDGGFRQCCRSNGREDTAMGGFEIYRFGLVKSEMDLGQIQIHFF